ncbi:MAG: ABC transporter ATP-binding protein, partial [Microbacteriaceae bacterium]|nr:ABC transporter ATP-binding protein [Microbacteriaceae bacterium]
YVVIIIASIVTAAATIVVPFLIGAATDAIVAIVDGTTTFDAGIGGVLRLAVGFLVAEVVVLAAASIGGAFGDVMSARMRATLSSRYYDHLLQLPQRYFDDELTGTIVSRLDRTITEVTQFVKSFANTFFTMLLTTVAVLVISAIHAWPLALLLLIVFPVYMWLTALTSKRWQEYEGDKNVEVDAARGRFSEVVSQMPVVKSFAQERREHTIFARRFDRTVELTHGQARHWHTMDALRRFALALVFFGIYAIIFVLTARGEFSLGTMVLLIQLMAMARQPVAMMSFIIDAGQHAIAGSKDYFAVMALEPDPREAKAEEQRAEPAQQRAEPVEARTDPSTGSGPSEEAGASAAPAIAFEGVGFGYEPGQRVLDDVSFEIAAGERVAFVSESGGGKSTIVSLLLGFYPIDSGCIRLFGQDTADLRMAALRERIGVVFQDPSLFSGTIRENIAYARPGASDEEITAAARRANAWEFIRRAPDGLDTVIGERGLKLSGGQKQRIAVARAMLKDAPVLILDEATSALDTKSERLVQAGLDDLMAGRTSLIIAHRLSTISQVDRIVTLRDGRVDEIGSPAELAASGGIYAELLALQQEGTRGSKKKLRDRYGVRG